MPTFEVYAHMLRWTHHEIAPYMFVESDVYVKLEVSHVAWDALLVQMAETEALAALGLDEQCQPLKT